MTGTSINRYAALILATATVVAAAACSQKPSSPMSPTSAAAPVTAAPVSGATISGQVGIGGQSSRTASVASGLTVSVIGTSRVAAVDGSGRFRLDNVPSGNVDLMVSGSGVNARVAVGQVKEQERVEIQIALSGASGTVEASEHVTPDDHAEVEGRIASIDTSSRMMQIGGTTVTISPTARISARGASIQLSDLHVQDRVQVSGSMQGGVVVATEVQLEDGPGPSPAPIPIPSPAPDPQGEVEFLGAVTAVGGSCPALTLTVGTSMVTTSASTAFLKASCSSLKAGQIVEVQGRQQANGSVAATRIQLDDEAPAPAPGPNPAPQPQPQPENEVEFTGNVTAAGGSCPALSLMVAGVAVKTSGATEFSGGSCGDVRTGLTLEVKGAKATDGSVAASRIKFEK